MNEYEITFRNDETTRIMAASQCEAETIAYDSLDEAYDMDADWDIINVEEVS